MSESTEELLPQVIDLLAGSDHYAAIELLNRQPSAMAAQAYEKLQSHLYWKQKNLPAMVMLSQAGIQHCLAESTRTTDAGAARDLRGIAKRLAFNLASFTWPGWDEPGISITRSDLAAGLQAARLNVRLADELDRPPKARANALWTLGAQQLAACDYPSAIGTFNHAATRLTPPEDSTMIRMLDGYSLMARLLAEPADASVRTLFDTAVEALAGDASDDGKEFARQLPVALALFEKSTPV
jgi:hypothetical protein